MAARWFGRFCVGAWVVTSLGCGPTVTELETGGGGESGSGPSEGDDTSTGDSFGGSDETSEVSVSCPRVVVGESAGALSPVVGDGYGYWSQLDGTLWRVALAEEIGAPEQLLASVDPYAGILVDGTRLLLAGGDALSWYGLVDGTVTLLVSEQQNPLSPALWNGRVLWLNYGSGILAGSMMSIALDTPSEPATMVLDSLGFPQSLAADASGVYVLVKQLPNFIQGALLEVDPQTGESTVRAVDMDGPRALAVTSDRIVWVEEGLSGPGRVRALGRTDQGLPTTLATVEDGQAVSLAADDQDVYYATFGSSGASLMHVDATSEGEPTVVRTFPRAVLDLAISPTHLLVTAIPADSAFGAVDSVTVLCRE